MTGIRIVAGERRGHRLAVPRGDTVRPTSERVREAVFDVLGSVSGLRVLDLFAGSGALGLEALSRGAAWATFVESDPTVVIVLRKNVTTLRYEDRSKVLVEDFSSALRFAKRAEEGYDLLFVDPPYRMLPDVMRVLGPLLPGLLSPGGLVVVEGPPDGRVEQAGEIVFRRRYGNTVVTMIAEGTRHT